MAKLLKLRRGSTSQHSSFTGAEGEVTIDTTKDTAVVHDGAQAGGRPLAREDMSNVSSASIAGQLGTDSIAVGKIAGGALPTDVTVASANIVDGTIVNADVNASAAIAGTKVSPNFGSQPIQTTGGCDTGNLTVTGQIVAKKSQESQIILQDSDSGNTGNAAETGIAFRDGGGTQQGVIGFSNSGDSDLYVDTTGSGNRINFRVGGSTTQLEIPSSGISVTGNIAVTGTVDGRDVAADGTKLDGIESGSTGDQTAAEIRTLVESASDSNVFTDADHSKLNGIESGATADQTNAQIASALSDQRPSMKGATFTDDGTSDPVVNIEADDAGPWAVRIANSSHNTHANAGIKIYQQSSGTGEVWMASHDGNFEDFNLRISNNSSNYPLVTLQGSDTSVKLSQGSTTRLQTTSSGVSVTGNISVTGTVDGRDLSTDGSKLDGIDSGAKDDQTKAEIDALNINADQVDGLHGHQFVRSDADDTMSGNLTLTGSLTTYNFVRVMSGQNSSDIYMADSDETERRIHCNSNRVGFLQSNNAWGAYCDNSGNWIASGNVTAYSDQRLKTDISTINDALGIVGKLRGVSYKWLKDGSDGIGVIAQEVEEVLPEVVVTGEGVNPVTQEIEEIKSVDYGKIVGVLINAINELKAEVDELKGGK